MACSPNCMTATSEPTAPMLVKVPQQYMLPVRGLSRRMAREKSRASAPPETQAASPRAGRQSRRGSGEGRPHRESMAERGNEPEHGHLLHEKAQGGEGGLAHRGRAGAHPLPEGVSGNEADENDGQSEQQPIHGGDRGKTLPRGFWPCTVQGERKNRRTSARDDLPPEKEITNAPPKVGCVRCRGCGRTVSDVPREAEEKTIREDDFFQTNRFSKIVKHGETFFFRGLFTVKEQIFHAT